MDGAVPRELLAELNSEVRSMKAQQLEHNSEDREQFEKVDRRLSGIHAKQVEQQTREARIEGGARVIIALLSVIVIGIGPTVYFLMKEAATKVLIEHKVIKIVKGE